MKKLPCPRCGARVVSRAWDSTGSGRPVLYHADGRSCYPPHPRPEDHEVPCSSCGRRLRFRLHVLMGEMASGVHCSMRCACGARWKTESRLPGVNVYVSAPTR